jgi:hypothetical protein
VENIFDLNVKRQILCGDFFSGSYFHVFAGKAIGCFRMNLQDNADFLFKIFDQY